MGGRAEGQATVRPAPRPHSLLALSALVAWALVAALLAQWSSQQATIAGLLATVQLQAQSPSRAAPATAAVPAAAATPPPPPAVTCVVPSPAAEMPLLFAEMQRESDGGHFFRVSPAALGLNPLLDIHVWDSGLSPAQCRALVKAAERTNECVSPAR